MDSRLASWDAHKGVLRDLYVVQGKKLGEVIQYMREHHQFSRSKSQYERIFKEWEFRKNLTKGEWDTIGRYITKRQRLGIKSAVYIDGIRVPEEKVKKQTQRHGFLTREERYRVRSQTPSLPERVVVGAPESADVVNPRRYLFSCFDDAQRLRDLRAPRYPYPVPSSMVFPNTTTGSSPSGSSFNTKDLGAKLPGPSCPTTEEDSYQKARNAIPEFYSSLRILLFRQGSMIPNPGVCRTLDEVLEQCQIPREFWLVAFLVANKLYGISPHLWFRHNAQHPILVESLEPLLPAKSPTGEAFLEKFLGRAAITEEDPHLMRELLKAIWKPGLPSGGRLVYFAVRTEDISTLRCMIEAGADVNTQLTSFSKTPLSAAVEQSHAEIAQILLDAGADVNMQAGPLSETPLLLAVKKNCLRMVRALLEAGADVDMPSSSGKTPILTARLLNHAEIEQLLLDSGANCPEEIPWLFEALLTTAGAEAKQYQI